MYVHRKMRYFITNMAFWKNTLGTAMLLQDYMSMISEFFPFKETFEKAEYYLVYLLILFYFSFLFCFDCFRPQLCYDKLLWVSLMITGCS